VGHAAAKAAKNSRKLRKRFCGDFIGPTCLLKTLDLGIALGSGVKIASM